MPQVQQGRRADKQGLRQGTRKVLTPTGQEKVFSQGMTHKGCPGYGGKGMSMFFTVLYSRPSSNRPSSSRQSRAPGWCRQLPAGWVLCLAESHALPAARLMPCCVCDTVVQLSDYMFSTWEHKWLTANFKPSLFAALPWLLLPGNLVVCKELAQDIAKGGLRDCPSASLPTAATSASPTGQCSLGSCASGTRSGQHSWPSDTCCAMLCLHCAGSANSCSCTWSSRPTSCPTSCRSSRCLVRLLPLLGGSRWGG